MNAVPIGDGVYWVGALNPELRVFDIVMETKYGTTYNAYLVKGEKIALVETVKAGFDDQLLERLAGVVNPEDVDYIVLNHTEPDHSGALGELLKRMPRAQVVGSRAAIMFLSQMLNAEFNNKVVNHGDEIDLGGKTLRFISAPFLHWPDSMFTYLPEDKILFTCDAFGCHYSSEKVFNDLVGDVKDAYKYYYDVIVAPFSKYVLEAAEKIKGLEVEVIAPSHGPVLRQDPWSYVELYGKWATKEKPMYRQKKVPVIYTSAYGYTGILAGEIAAGLAEGGVEAELLNMCDYSTADLIEKIDESAGFLIGSPTINRDAVPPVWELLAHVSAIVNKDKPVAAFGSYGWSGEAVKLIEQRLQGLQCKVVQPGLRVNFVPSQKSQEEARDFGRTFAGAVGGKPLQTGQSA